MRHLGMKTALVLAVMATGCVTDERVEVQLCPEGSLKAEPGVCGCDVEDVDGDGDTIMDCVDLCPEDQNKKSAWNMWLRRARYRYRWRYGARLF